MNMARSGDVSRCHRCGLWSNGSAPITVSASITMRSSWVTVHAVYLDYPTRTEQKNGGNLVVMRPDRRRPRDDFFKGEGGGGSLVVVQPDRDRRLQDDFGRAAADSEKDVSPIHAKPRKPLDQNPEGMDVAGFSKHGGKCYADNLRRYCNSGKLIQACCVIDEMVLHGQIPETKCCVRIIRGLVKTGKANKARHVLEVMVLSGGVPDTISCNMLIAQLCRGGQLSSALQVLEDMRFRDRKSVV